MLRRVFTVCVFTVSFIINPMYLAGGCIASNEPAFEYGEADMAALLRRASDTASYHFYSQGRDYELLLATHESAGPGASKSATRAQSWQTQAFACGTRTFQQSAAACIDVSELLAEGELTLRVNEEQGARTLVDAAKVTGSLFVPGLQLREAELSLGAGAPAVHAMLRQVDASDKLALVEVTWDGGGDTQQAVSYHNW